MPNSQQNQNQKNPNQASQDQKNSNQNSQDQKNLNQGSQDSKKSANSDNAGNDQDPRRDADLPRAKKQ